MIHTSALPAVMLAIVMFSSLACAARTNGRVADDATALTSRVEAYWERREAKDLVGAYAFYCSAYRKRVPQAEFLRLTRLMRFDLHDVRVAPVTETGSRVEVTVLFRMIVPVLSPEPIETRTTEWWARDADRQWCKEDEPLVLPFPRSGPPAPSGS